MGSFYASSVIAADKHRFWERIIDQAFGVVDVQIADESTFFGELRSAPFGDMTLAEVICDYEIATRSRQHIAHDTSASFVLVMLQSGTLQIEQAGRECVLTPGTFTLFDLNSPYTYRHVERTQVLDVVIPSALLRARVRDPQSLVVRPFSAGRGIGRVTADLLVSMIREVEAFPPWAAQSYCARVVDLIGLLFEAAQDDLPIADSAIRSALYRRCVAIIETHLADPALGPAKVAELAGISVRYLHKIFQDAGEPVGSYIRSCRLERCHRDLSDPAKKDVSIIEIAYRAGFQRQSHFSNSFKRQYGRSPSDVRHISQVPGTDDLSLCFGASARNRL